MPNFGEAVKSQDYFGHIVSLNFDKLGDKFRTLPGGISSIFIKVVVIWYAITQII